MIDNKVRFFMEKKEGIFSIVVAVMACNFQYLTLQYSKYMYTESKFSAKFR